METLNKWMVGANADGSVRILLPPTMRLTSEDALLLAAWLVAMSGRPRADFDLVLDAVKNT